MAKESYTKIKINSEFITLGQFLKFANVIDNGSMAKFFVKEHIIKVNDEDENRRGRKLYGGEKIVIDNSMFFEITK